MAEKKQKNKKSKTILGQNFLINREIALEIVDSCNLSANDSAVEIGVGEGILTSLIAKKVKNLTLIEIDPFYCNFIAGKLGVKDNIEILNIDALKYNYPELKNRLNSKLRVISNLPYEISSPIIDKFIKEKDAFVDFTLMFQKEFADRLSANSNDSARGALSVIAEINFNIEKLFDVKKHNFSPAPDVDSAVLRLIPRSVENFDEGSKWAVGEGSLFFNYFVHQIFKLRRKKMKNSIYASFFGIPADIKEQIFTNDAGVDLNKRPQELTAAEFIIAAKKYDEYLNDRRQNG